MPRPAQLPQWATSGVNILEPSSGKKASGWLSGEKPSAQWWNWWQRLAHDWIEYLDVQARAEDAAAAAAARALVAEVGAILSPIDRSTGGSNVQQAFAGYTSFRVPKIISCGNAGSIHQSDNGGRTWSAITPAASFSGTFYAAATLGTRIYLAGQSGMLQSVDADTGVCTQRTSGFGADAIYAIAYRKADGNAVIVGANGKTSYSASNNVNFTANTALVGAGYNISTVAVADGLPFVCVGYFGGSTRANYMHRSMSGAAWTPVDLTSVLASGEFLHRITYSEKLGFVCLVKNSVGTISSAVVSTDAVTWTKKGTLGATYGHIVGTRGGAILMSDVQAAYTADGANWFSIPYLRSTSTPESFHIVEQGGARQAILSTGNSGGLVISPPWIY